MKKTGEGDPVFQLVKSPELVSASDSSFQESCSAGSKPGASDARSMQCHPHAPSARRTRGPMPVRTKSRILTSVHRVEVENWLATSRFGNSGFWGEGKTQKLGKGDPVFQLVKLPSWFQPRTVLSRRAVRPERIISMQRFSEWKLTTDRPPVDSETLGA